MDAHAYSAAVIVGFALLFLSVLEFRTALGVAGLVLMVWGAWVVVSGEP